MWGAVRLLVLIYVVRGFSIGCALVSSKFLWGWWLGSGWMVSFSISDYFCILSGFCTCLSWWSILLIERYLVAKIGTTSWFRCGGSSSLRWNNCGCPASPERRRPSAASFRPRTHSDGPVSQTLLTSTSKARAATRLRNPRWLDSTMQN